MRPELSRAPLNNQLYVGRGFSLAIDQRHVGRGFSPAIDQRYVGRGFSPAIDAVLGVIGQPVKPAPVRRAGNDAR